ncbi:oligosaccharide flippase family protein [Bacillus kexueae]|uniref:oligosaccharide flippase family protein n=1 Tax=Aeribacillus kexueae TaxID=2078952 RepID=UPI001FAF52F8|nr:oligosaccharide flippase family protein [Bacillus kexueae]
MKEQVINIALRSITLLAKFSVVILLAKFLSEKELGDYSLVVSFITICVYFVGFEYYINLTRQYLKIKRRKLKTKLLYNQLYFHLLMFTVSTSLLWVVVFIGIIEKEYAVILLILLFFEFLSQEVSRILITFSQTVMSNLVTFIRSGMWVYLLISMYYLDPSSVNLKSIIFLWTIHSALSVFIGLFFMKDQFNLKKIRKPSFRIINYGIKRSIPFFFSTIFYLISINVDKFILKFFYGSSIVGIYTFYFSIINSIYSFIFAGAISIYLPKIINYYNKRNYKLFKSKLRKMQKSSFFILIIFSVFSILLLDFVINLINKDAFDDYKSLLIILLVGLVFNISSQAYHYTLYIMNQDKLLMKASFYSLNIIIISNIITVPLFSIYGAAFSYSLGMLVLFVIKIIYYKKLGELT